jgi:hypothetical protein
LIPIAAMAAKLGGARSREARHELRDSHESAPG